MTETILLRLDKLNQLDNNAFARKHKEIWTFAKSQMVAISSRIPELAAYMLLCPLLARLGVGFLPNVFPFSVIVRSVDAASGYSPAVLVYAFILSTFVGQSLVFIFNRRFTFHSNANVALSTSFAVALSIFTIIASGFAGPVIVGLVTRVGILPVFWAQLLGKYLFMLSTILWMYPANRFVVHPVKREKKEKPHDRS